MCESFKKEGVVVWECKRDFGCYGNRKMCVLGGHTSFWPSNRRVRHVSHQQSRGFSTWRGLYLKGGWGSWGGTLHLHCGNKERTGKLDYSKWSRRWQWKRKRKGTPECCNNFAKTRSHWHGSWCSSCCVVSELSFPKEETHNMLKTATPTQENEGWQVKQIHKWV